MINTVLSVCNVAKNANSIWFRETGQWHSGEHSYRAHSIALGSSWWCFHTEHFISIFLTFLTCEKSLWTLQGCIVQRSYHKYLAYGDNSINIIYYNSHQINVLLYSSFICPKLNFSFKNIGIHLTSNYAKYILIFLMYFRWDILENYSTSRAFFFADQHMSIFITLLKNAYYGIIKSVRRLKFKCFILICKLLINDFMHRICWCLKAVYDQWSSQQWDCF